MQHKWTIITTILLAATAIMLVATPAVLATGQGYGPGRVALEILAGRDHVSVGDGGIWNSRDKLHIQLDPADGWRIKSYHVDLGGGEDYSPPLTTTGNPKIGHFDYKETFDLPYMNEANEDGHPFRRTLLLDLGEDLGFQWGAPYADLRVQGVAIFLNLVQLDDAGKVTAETGAWVVPELVAWIVAEEDSSTADETPAGTDGTEVAVDGESIVADTATGEVSGSEATEVKSTGKGKVAKVEHQKAQKSWVVDEAEEVIAFDGGRWGWWFKYEMAHPKTGHFIDSPVGGLTVQTPTYEGVTDETGAFDYFPGEEVQIAIGSVELGFGVSDHKISPLDLWPLADADDPRVINMARLLQSLDADASSKAGIMITPEIAGCLEAQGVTYPDFADEDQIDSLIDGTITCAGNLEPSVTLVAVSAEDAKAHLEETLNSTMLRKNISRTPDLSSSKSKLNIMGMWFPALRANGDPTVIEYYDEDGNQIRTTDQAKPIVVVYTDGVPETGYEDIFAAISRDDGNTFKRVNLSRMADKSSFTLENGATYYGECKKPVFGIDGNNILVAWTSKYAKGGKPAYAIDTEDDYTYDDPYYTADIWGVAGPQRSVDYTEQGFPEVGEVPYSAVWVARGTIVTQSLIDKGGFWAQYAEGDIVWFKPERLTSGRRDANQVFLGTGQSSGFAVAWQEDPEGLRPGGADGPGPGWGGATTNHKTDIWYSYVTKADFLKVDSYFVAGGDPEHELDVLERPKALVPMSLPVRVTDNDVVNTDNLMVEIGEDGLPVQDEEGNWTPVINPDTDGDGTHAYGYAIDGLCESFYTKVNEQGETKQVCVTADGRLLDGDTGASRPNLFLQTYTKTDGSKSAWAIFAYEETKGVGAGAPENAGEGQVGLDEYVIDEGKNAIYHSFDFQNPDVVSAGTIINHPERDEDGNLVYLKDETGALILDYQGLPQLAYENARRPRFILQGKNAMGNAGTVLLVLYKEGQEGSGRPSDIMMRRMVAPTKGNPYASENFVCDAWKTVNGQEVCVAGAMNMSSVTPTVTTASMGDPEVEDAYGAVKVVEWTQNVDNLFDRSSTNPYDDARAHRGSIRGDVVILGFSYTPNWAAARNGNDKYDFYVRRSFDGGVTWTTDPAGRGVTHCYTWTYPSGTQSAGEKVEVCNTFEAGAFESMRNLSQLANAKESVIEPRIVGTPGTIKDPVTGAWTGIAEDKQNPDVFYVSYGTSTNPKKDPETGEQEEPVPADLYYSLSTNNGETYVEVAWHVNPDSDGTFAGETVYRWDYLAKGDQEQGEAQLRMTPDGSRFYATWLDEGAEGSDILFRRIMSPEFAVNHAASEDASASASATEEAGELGEFTDDSGGQID